MQIRSKNSFAPPEASVSKKNAARKIKFGPLQLISINHPTHSQLDRTINFCFTFLILILILSQLVWNIFSHFPRPNSFNFDILMVFWTSTFVGWLQHIRPKPFLIYFSSHSWPDQSISIQRFEPLSEVFSPSRFKNKWCQASSKATLKFETLIYPCHVKMKLNKTFV